MQFPTFIYTLKAFQLSKQSILSLFLFSMSQNNELYLIDFNNIHFTFWFNAVKWKELGLNSENIYSAYNCSKSTLLVELIKVISKTLIRSVIKPCKIQIYFLVANLGDGDSVSSRAFQCDVGCQCSAFCLTSCLLGAVSLCILCHFQGGKKNKVKCHSGYQIYKLESEM